MTIDAGLVLALGVVGRLVAWVLRRFTTLSIKNVYLLTSIACAAFAAAIAAQSWATAITLAPAVSLLSVAAVSGRRWRMQDLGAGEDLRQHELARRWAWQPRPRRLPGERKYIASQGEIVHVRPWPHDVEYVPMTADQDSGPRLPIGEGQHLFECGGTGTGKTTTARRVLAARTLMHRAAALLIDQKGDPEDEHQLRRIAAAAGRPFVLFDPRDQHTDRWQPRGAHPPTSPPGRSSRSRNQSPTTPTSCANTST